MRLVIVSHSSAVELVKHNLRVIEKNSNRLNQNAKNIEKIENYKLPTDKELAEQAVNDIICETCYLSEQCNRISCLRPKKELGQLKREMTKMVMGGKKK